MSGTGNRKIILFSFTGTGASLGRRLCRKLQETGHICEAYAPEKYAQEGDGADAGRPGGTDRRTVGPCGLPVYRRGGDRRAFIARG